MKFNKIAVNRLFWRSQSISPLHRFEGKKNTSLQLNFEDAGLSASGTYTCVAESNNSKIEEILQIQPPSKAIFKKFITSENDYFNITLYWIIVSDFPIINCSAYDVLYNEYWVSKYDIPEEKFVRKNMQKKSITL